MVSASPRHVILMGDPTHFSVKGGANPHTRDRWGRKKSVDRDLAIRQWHRMRDLMTELGFEVVVVPPHPDWPGLVYPANAGFRIGDEFVLSNLTPTRAGEAPIYRAVIESLGLRCHTVEHRFEGEADLFPAGDVYLFTYGGIEAQRFVPRIGIPPWRRVYGFRSQPAVLDEINAIAKLDRRVLRVPLRDERYYHGDTCLCSFGAGRRSLLVYPEAIRPDADRELRDLFADRRIDLRDEDAAIYAANSFAFTRRANGSETHHLVMPENISARLRDAVEAQGVEVVPVDVSEFLKKGGGSVKCMIGDLGEIG